MATPFGISYLEKRCIPQKFGGRRVPLSKNKHPREAVRLLTISPQRAQNGRQQRIDLGIVCAYVLDFFERNELRSGDLACRTPRLVVEVNIPSPYIDEASYFPRLKVFGDCSFSKCCAPCRLEGYRVVVEPPRPERVWEPGTSERLQRLQERLHTPFPSRFGQSLRNGVREWPIGLYSVWLLAPDHEREHAFGRMFADPKAESAPPHEVPMKCACSMPSSSKTATASATRSGIA